MEVTNNEKLSNSLLTIVNTMEFFMVFGLKETTNVEKVIKALLFENLKN